jgi:two-component system chemotaxis sensor kinase CheA
VEDDSGLFRLFVAESREHLEQAEEALRRLGERPDEREAVQQCFRALHSLKGNSGYFAMPAVTALAHASEHLLDGIRSAAVAADATRCDALHLAVQRLGVLLAEPPAPATTAGDDTLIARLGALADTAEDEAPEAEAAAPRLGDLLVDRGLPRERIEAAAAALRPGERLGDRLVSEGLPREAVEGAAQELAGLKRRSGGFARVSIAKLDALVDAATTAITAHEALAHALAGAAQDLQDAAASAARPLRELSQLALDLRLVPIRTAFAKAERACEDAARKLGRAVALRIVGGDTGIDRSIAEAIGDPLIHLIRNAVDHGIEPAAERQARAKPEAGTITLSAHQDGDLVVVTVADDGRGIDAERVRRKAIEQGLLAADAVPPRAELLNLIFEPGFSTASAVTDISGRGVGMDVVRRNIETLGGSVTVETEVGVGSTLTLRVPAGTALLDALVVRAAGERFLLPVRSVLAVRSSTAVADEGAAVSLAHEFSLPAAHEEYAVVVAHPAGRLALAVDGIDGLQQVLAKPLDLGVAHHPALAGAALMPDGVVALVLEPFRLGAAAA